MPRKTGRKYDDELKHPEIAGWFEHLSKRSEGMAWNYLSRLAQVTHGALQMSPAKLLAMDQEALDEAAIRCIDYQQDHDLLKSTVKTWECVLLLFLKWNGRTLHHRANIPNAKNHPRSENEWIPTPDELGRVLEACTPFAAAVLSLTAFAGLRPHALGDGVKGLRVRDLPDLRVADGEAEFLRVPALIKVPRALSKNGKRFFTFLGPEGCARLVKYLRWRQKRGEAVGPDSPLVVPCRGSPRFHRTDSLSACVRRAMRKAGLSQRPYVLRNYFANRCMMAAPEGLLPEWRRFMMGHKGGVQMRYALRKRLPEDTVEAMRSAYARALPYLETNHPMQAGPGLVAFALILYRDLEPADQLVEKSDEELEALFWGQQE